MGLVVSESKAKYMTSDGKYIIKVELQLGEYKFERINQYPYLGTVVQMDNALK